MEKEILLQYLFFYQSVSGLQVYYERKQNEWIVKDGELYKPLFDKTGVTLDISPSLLIPLENIKNNEVIQFPEKILSIGTQKVGDKCAKSTQKAGELCAVSEQKADDEQELIRKFAGKKPVIINQFAHLSQSTDMQKVCLQLEKLFIQTLKSVKDPRSILKIKELYDITLSYQKKNDLFKVAEILERMEQKRIGQRNIISTREKEIRNKRRRKIIKLSLLTTSIILVLITLLTFRPPHRMETNNNFNFDSLVNVYQTENKVKFWQWRNDTILNSLKTMSFNNENEIFNQIKIINSEL